MNDVMHVKSERFENRGRQLGNWVPPWQKWFHFSRELSLMSDSNEEASRSFNLGKTSKMSDETMDIRLMCAT